MKKSEKIDLTTKSATHRYHSTVLVFITAILILTTPRIASSQVSETEPYKRKVVSTNILGLAPHFDDATSNFNLHFEYYTGDRKSVTIQACYLHAFKSSMGNYLFLSGEEIKGFQV